MKCNCPISLCIGNFIYTVFEDVEDTNSGRVDTDENTGGASTEVGVENENSDTNPSGTSDSSDSTDSPSTDTDTSPSVVPEPEEVYPEGMTASMFRTVACGNRLIPSMGKYFKIVNDRAGKRSFRAISHSKGMATRIYFDDKLVSAVGHYTLPKNGTTGSSSNAAIVPAKPPFHRYRPSGSFGNNGLDTTNLFNAMDKAGIYVPEGVKNIFVVVKSEDNRWQTYVGCSDGNKLPNDAEIYDKYRSPNFKSIASDGLPRMK